MFALVGPRAKRSSDSNSETGGGLLLKPRPGFYANKSL